MFVDVVLHIRSRSPRAGNPNIHATDIQPANVNRPRCWAPRIKEDTDFGDKTDPGHDAVPNSRLAERGVFDPDIQFSIMKYE
jgi:hypothetical protein